MVTKTTVVAGFGIAATVWNYSNGCSNTMASQAKIAPKAKTTHTRLRRGKRVRLGFVCAVVPVMACVSFPT